MAKVGTGAYYELVRDRIHHPTCWELDDNHCLPHFHSALELTYMHSGCMEALIDGKPFVVRRGELLVIAPYSVHAVETPRASHCTVLVIPRDYIRPFAAWIQDKTFDSVVLRGGDVGEVARAMGMVLALPPRWEQPGRHVGQESFVERGQIYTILGLLMRNLVLRGRPRGDEVSLVQGILAYLDSHYREAVDLAHLAARFGYSQSRISHVFNTEVGCNIPQYVNTLRARAAAALLLEEKVSVTRAAMETGFESMRTFYRAFRLCFGVTPRAFAALPPVDWALLLQSSGLHQLPQNIHA